jgi:hypothetical protein
MKRISLTQNKFAIVDDEDYAELSKYKWCAANHKGKWCAVRYSKEEYRKTGSRGTLVSMHRQIMKAEKREQIDHKDGNELNNQKENLRFSTQQQNVFNQMPIRQGTSKYKGVSWCRESHDWYASIKHNGKSKNLGHFINEINAAKAYDTAAKQLFGEFARTNFPKERKVLYG